MNSSTLPRITLRPGKEKSLQRRHPWIFSGAIARKDKDLHDGDIVEVYDAQRQYLATGHYQPTTIAVRLFSFEQRSIDRDFWREKLLNAIEFRRKILLPNPQTTMYRLVNGEGDGMPGLIIDVYGRHLVMQVHSMGMYRLREILAELLTELIPDTQAICLKTAIETDEEETTALNSGWIYGQPDAEVIASENGILFKIDILNGQKTGFFLDQRDSRAMVGELAKDRTVLNMFSYSGGFSLYALRGGAQQVDSVDISQKAIDLVEENVRLMGGDFAQRHNAVCEDVFAFLDRMPDHYYDLIILDPPAFAKHHRVKEQGIKGYRNINRKTMEKIRPGGLLFTFSCSQAISRDDFQTLVFSAAALAGKNVRVVRHLQHAPCHPVSIFHPEGEYLKGLLVEVSS
ncbi:MAG: class I SAM-dependent rRNA methyltransferase [Bacteroidales bacterium]|nr:class I SAM-dependent rRNA methyltransferase [Bacteroidales bacterium]